MKRIVLRSAAVVLVLVLIAAGAVTFVATTDTGARWALARANAASGGALRWSAAEGTLMSGLRLEGLVFENTTGGVSIRSLEFSWQPWRLLDGTLVLDRVELVGLRREARGTSDAPFTEADLRESLFSLPVAIELRAFRASEIEIVDASGATFAFDSIAGAGSLDSDALALSSIEWQRDDVRVTGELNLGSDLAVAATAAWQVQVNDQPYAGNLTIGGALPDITVEHALTQPVLLDSEGSVATGMFDGAEPRFDLSHIFPAQALAAFAQPDLLLQGTATTRGSPAQVDVDASIHAETPAFAPLDLVVALNYADNLVRIDSAALNSEQIAVDGSGQLQLEPLALQFDWMLNSLVAGERLPQLELEGVTGVGSVELTEAEGTIAGALRIDNLTGTLNDHPLAIAGNMTGDQVAGVTALELRASSGENTLDVNGSAGTELALQWELQAPALDTLWQGLAGNLAGSGSISGTPEMPQAIGALQGALQLEREDGTLRLESVAMNADYGPNGNNVELTLGVLSLDGAGDARVLLQQGELTLSGTPASHGARGNFTAPEDSVRFSIQGAATDGDWRGTVQDLTLDSRAGEWEMDAPFAVNYVAGTLTLAENCWAYAGVRACFSGSKPAAQGFNADVAITAFPLAWLNAAATAPASKPSGLQALQEAFGFALPESTRVEGEVDAQLSVRNFRNGSWDSLDAVLDPRDLAVEITQQSEDEDLAPPVQRFNLLVNNSELHAAGATWSGAVDLQVSREDGTASITQGSLRGNATLAADGTLDGSADVSFSDMSWIEFALPDVRGPEGMLTGTLGLAGTRAQPQLQARMQMRNGQFDLPLYGLEVRNVNLDLETGANGALRLVGSAQSGDGTLNLSADVTNPLQAQRAVTAELSGEKILAFDTEYATVTLSPQLQGSFADNALAVNGSIEVSDTEVDLETLFGVGRDSVKVSRDVVIVAGAAGSEDASQQALQITADLVVRLGENVHVRGYDLDAFLGGELTVEQAPGRPVLVYGELDIPEGRYEIYNQELNARDGRLVFFGNPANPMLDVRAFRETASGEVGVLLTGNLDSIQGRLYSTPALPENEILALLVTGKSFNNVNAEESDALVGAIASFGLARGEGLTQRVGNTLGLDTVTVGTGDTFQDSALGLGKYLTPDLLMRYKIGLFDRQSVLGIEYTLSERLKLEVETGISQSVDLNYTIEKD